MEEDQLDQLLLFDEQIDETKVVKMQICLMKGRMDTLRKGFFKRIDILNKEVLDIRSQLLEINEKIKQRDESKEDKISQISDGYLKEEQDSLVYK